MPPRIPIDPFGVLIVAPWLWLTCPPTKRSTPLVADATIDPVLAFGL